MDTDHSSAVLDADDSRESGLERGFEIMLILATIYFASAGPVFRMYMHREISFRCLAIYRPLISAHSPLYPVFRKYMVLWM